MKWCLYLDLDIASRIDPAGALEGAVRGVCNSLRKSSLVSRCDAGSSSGCGIFSPFYKVKLIFIFKLQKKLKIFSTVKVTTYKFI